MTEIQNPNDAPIYTDAEIDKIIDLAEPHGWVQYEKFYKLIDYIRQLRRERDAARAEVEAANKELESRDLALYMIARQPPVTEQDIVWAEDVIRKIDREAGKPFATDETEYFDQFGEET